MYYPLVAYTSSTQTCVYYPLVAYTSSTQTSVHYPLVAYTPARRATQTQQQSESNGIVCIVRGRSTYCTFHHLTPESTGVSLICFSGELLRSREATVVNIIIVMHIKTLCSFHKGIDYVH